jgi:hypothetical protein
VRWEGSEIGHGKTKIPLLIRAALGGGQCEHWRNSKTGFYLEFLEIRDVLQNSSHFKNILISNGQTHIESEGLMLVKSWSEKNPLHSGRPVTNRTLHLHFFHILLVPFQQNDYTPHIRNFMLERALCPFYV